MMKNKKRIFLPLFLLMMLFLMTTVFAVDKEAESITGACSVELSTRVRSSDITDGNGYTAVKLPAGGEIVIQAGEQNIGALYIEFGRIPEKYTLTVDGVEQTAGEHSFLHEYISGLDAREITLHFEAEETRVCDIYVFSAGEKQDWVQDWADSWDRCDVLLLPTHSDDDQLFFAGVIPWCIEQGARVQVAYMVQHFDSGDRMNELLDGLWTCGLRNYPVLGDFRDMSFVNYKTTLAFYNNTGVMWEDIEGRQVELYRRFQPQVVITHAFNGEYGHGAHILYANTSTAASTISGDENYYPDSLEKYGVWEVPKVYVHNYSTTPILLELDTPLEKFDGMTAYEVALEAFKCHPSQYNAFYGWLCSGKGTAAGIKYYNPREYGLFSSTVGLDYSGDTFFDNLVLYDEQERLIREEEEARVAAEEAAAKAAEQERIAAEKAEEERIADEKAEAERLAAEKAAADKEKQNNILLVIAFSVSAFVLVLLFVSRKKKKSAASVLTSECDKTEANASIRAVMISADAESPVDSADTHKLTQNDSFEEKKEDSI